MKMINSNNFTPKIIKTLNNYINNSNSNPAEYVPAERDPKQINQICNKKLVIIYKI